jgi:1-acyl-sn-glycerol-3-phosphate acyltransferase
MVRVGRVLRQTWISIRDAETGRESPESVKRKWSSNILGFVGVKLRVHGAPSAARPTIFAGNHLSYLDIPLLLSTVPRACFVAKAELAGWPLFGRGMKRADTIFVRRNSVTSRGAARAELLRAVREEGKSVAVFPAGTTRLTEDLDWRPGAFRLAEETGAPLQLFRLRYDPLRRAAFVDDDSFLAHLLRLTREGGVTAELEFAPPIVVTDWRRTLREGQAWCREFLVK